MCHVLLKKLPRRATDLMPAHSGSWISDGGRVPSVDSQLNRTDNDEGEPKATVTEKDPETETGNGMPSESPIWLMRVKDASTGRSSSDRVAPICSESCLAVPVRAYARALVLAQRRVCRRVRVRHLHEWVAHLLSCS
jgi:hypothetical protein